MPKVIFYFKFAESDKDTERCRLFLELGCVELITTMSVCLLTIMKFLAEIFTRR